MSASVTSLPADTVAVPTPPEENWTRAGWGCVIGLEVHVQLRTRSKIFSAASTAFGAEPNTQLALLDIALPGTLPVPNRAAVMHAIRLGSAIGAQVNRRSVFARKHYFYPDLPKGYQISQYELPVVEGGFLAYELDGIPHQLPLTRAHLEEDAGKSLHEDFAGQSGIDLNRTGTPLLEVVSEPGLYSPAAAVAYARALYRLVTWLEICDGNMQEGSFRMDANVSIRPPGTMMLCTRREIKNLNSFRFLEQAILAEIDWQIAEHDAGRTITQATVLFDAERGETRAMRTKEDAHDYRYFPDPDLPPLVLEEDWIDECLATMPELPEALAARWQAVHGLSEREAVQMCENRPLARYFEDCVAAGAEPRLACTWLAGEVAAQLKREEGTMADCPLSPVWLAALLIRLDDKTINAQAARMLLRAQWAETQTARETPDPDQKKTGMPTDEKKHEQSGAQETPETARQALDAAIKRLGLRQDSSEDSLLPLVVQVLVAQPQMVAEYCAGKEKALNALVGQCMKAAQGRADPATLKRLLLDKMS